MEPSEEDLLWQAQGRRQSEAAYASEDVIYEQLAPEPRQRIKRVKLLRYIELKSGGYSDNGPAWIGYVTPSKTGRTVYFNRRALGKLKGQNRLPDGGNDIDMETGESFWISGVKKNGCDRHWAGGGRYWSKQRRLRGTSRLEASVISTDPFTR